jgi:predicted peptidase
MNRSLIIFMISTVSMMSGNTLKAQDNSEFLKLMFTGASKDTLRYRLFVPADKENKLPLVIFLHGSGERGNDNVKQMKNGVTNFALPSNQGKYPCYVMVPQCPENKKWVEMDFRRKLEKQPETISQPLGLVMELTRELLYQYPVDPDRIYVTGLSMGGYGTWDLVTRYPSFFAAAVPVCGGGDETLAGRLTELPVWAFHGKKDDIVPPERSADMIKAIEKAGGKPKYTEYPNLGHACWDETYSNPELFKWLFLQKKKNR